MQQMPKKICSVFSKHSPKGYCLARSEMTSPLTNVCLSRWTLDVESLRPLWYQPACHCMLSALVVASPTSLQFRILGRPNRRHTEVALPLKFGNGIDQSGSDRPESYSLGRYSRSRKSSFNYAPWVPNAKLVTAYLDRL
jgi:hypothetical protein